MLYTFLNPKIGILKIFGINIFDSITKFALLKNFLILSDDQSYFDKQIDDPKDFINQIKLFNTLSIENFVKNLNH